MSYLYSQNQDFYVKEKKYFSLPSSGFNIIHFCPLQFYKIVVKMQ